MFRRLLDALTIALHGDADGARILVNDLIDQMSRNPSIDLVTGTVHPDAIRSSFVWVETVQGWDFWNSLHAEWLNYELTNDTN